MNALFRYFLLLLAFFPGWMAGQENHCTGSRYVQLYYDDSGRDVRLSCIVDYGGSGDILVGGMAGGDILLSRLSAEGVVRWQRAIATGGESTELSLVNGLLVDPEGMIAGVVSHFSDNRQTAGLFRYNPVTDQLLYYRKAPYESDPTGILLGGGGEYVVSGSRIGAPSPIFRRGLLQRFRRNDGSPLGQGHYYDLAGEETIFDLLPHPDGGYLAAGAASVRGSAGAGRSVLLQVDPGGNLLSSRVGPVADDRNARLFAFDVEVEQGRTYLLQWGDLDRITGAEGTLPIITAFAAGGEVLWSRKYDLTASSGEVGIEMAIHNGGLLLYGYSLVGKRDIFLLQLEFSGEVRWARRYSFPGNAQVYQRGNQQLLARPFRILVAATYSFRGTQPHEGLLLQLDGEGRPLAECLVVEDSPVAVSNLLTVWSERSLSDTMITADWVEEAADRPETELVAVDDCDRPCAGCTERSFSSRVLCPGDTILVAGSWRSEPGLYRDTLSGRAGACDTVATTEIVDAPPISARYLQLPGCGLAGGTIEVIPSGGLPPYGYAWSDGPRTGSRGSLDPGAYQVTVSDVTGCQSFVLPVTVAAAADTDFRLEVTVPSCPGGSDGGVALLPAGSGRLKLLSDTTFTADAITGLASGFYSLIVRLDDGCEVYREAEVPPSAPFHLQLSGPERGRLGDPLTYTAQVTGGSPPLAFTWSADSTASCVACPSYQLTARQTGWITVEAGDASGCTARDSLFLVVERGPPRVYVPTAFSPNGDGHNDLWVPGLGPDIAAIVSWKVYHRWGGLVWSYEAGGANYWDGAVAGVYFYTLVVRLIDGTVAELSGEVTVVR
ncbi:hypothetical protein GGR26_001395 [Lewinella marina]|uniref:Gliding motility-associated C-terminal domain-containing protein n=1 Tax=Neolewinella marina TaxID=438751 RepID=A0A2G0CFH1_9BACT|nr:gliding motility-associated C-terminal domain-containing protein [Neolewinella marina]NJB85650.1 hypothetical protein [Neolewinella marina]PHK98667.1 hypothetical protein CGL56_09370 [Neolewinella marina]